VSPIDIFQRALVPDIHTVLGLRLRPFSLGHKILFSRLGLPFFTGHRDATNADLITAVMICASRFDDARQFIIEGKETSKACAKWMKRIRMADFNEAFTVFMRYLDEGMTSYYFDTVPGGRSSGVPSDHSIMLRLMEKLHLTQSDVLDRCYGLCLCDYVALGAKEGHGSIRDKDEDQRLMKMADQFAETEGGLSGAI
jgi:hypothetical protein